MPEIEIDLPVVGADFNQWGGKLNAGILAMLQAVNGTVADFTVRDGELIAIHVDGSETPVGPLPVGPQGAPGGSDAETAMRIASGPQTQAALSAQIGQLAVLIVDEAGEPLAGRTARFVVDNDDWITDFTIEEN